MLVKILCYYKPLNEIGFSVLLIILLISMFADSQGRKAGQPGIPN